LNSNGLDILDSWLKKTSRKSLRQLVMKTLLHLPTTVTHLRNNGKIGKTVKKIKAQAKSSQTSELAHQIISRWTTVLQKRSNQTASLATPNPKRKPPAGPEENPRPAKRPLLDPSVLRKGGKAQLIELETDSDPFAKLSSVPQIKTGPLSADDIKNKKKHEQFMREFQKRAQVLKDHTSSTPTNSRNEISPKSGNSNSPVSNFPVSNFPAVSFEEFPQQIDPQPSKPFGILKSCLATPKMNQQKKIVTWASGNSLTAVKKFARQPKHFFIPDTEPFVHPVPNWPEPEISIPQNDPIPPREEIYDHQIPWNDHREDFLSQNPGSMNQQNELHPNWDVNQEFPLQSMAYHESVPNSFPPSPEPARLFSWQTPMKLDLPPIFYTIRFGRDSLQSGIQKRREAMQPRKSVGSTNSPLECDDKECKYDDFNVRNIPLYNETDPVLPPEEPEIIQIRPAYSEPLPPSRAPVVERSNWHVATDSDIEMFHRVLSSDNVEDALIRLTQTNPDVARRLYKHILASQSNSYEARQQEMSFYEYAQGMD